MKSAIAQYRRLGVESLVDSASPHQLIEMLFDGAAARLQKAAGCIAHGDIGGRSAAISETVAIMSGLQASLDLENGGDLAENLDALYDYMQRRLFRANADNDPQPIHEVLGLVATLREAWGAISADVTSLQHA